MKLADLLAAKAIINGGGSGGGDVVIFGGSPDPQHFGYIKLDDTEIGWHYFYLLLREQKAVKIYFATYEVSADEQYSGAFYIEIISVYYNQDLSYSFVIRCCDGSVAKIENVTTGTPTFPAIGAVS